jgi:two-component system sensor histidine kinase KdpD
VDAGVRQLRVGGHGCGVLVHLARTTPLDLIFGRPNGRIGAARTLHLAVLHFRRRARAAEFRALLLSLSAIGLLTAIYFGALGVTNPTIVALSYLLVVLVVAAISVRWVAIATSLTAFLSFNYFFLPPVGTWTIADPENWVALFALLAVSVIASHLSAQVRRRAQDATARRDELARLFDLTRDILLTTDTADAVALVARYVARRFGLEGVTICLPGDRGWELHHSGERPLDLEAARLDAALTGAPVRIEFDANERPSARHSPVGSGDVISGWLVPLQIGTRPIGLLAMRGADLEPGTRDAIAGVTAIAIERAQLLEERKEAEVVRRGAELKAALLASLGHDLKTPLTAVTVAANNLDASWLTPEQRREQTEIVRTELERLNRLFEDLVDMARIETHAVAAEPEWVQPAEIVEAAARHVEHSLAHRTLETDAGTEGALVRLDPRLTSAALAHVLENAGQYSPPGSTITVKVTLSSDEFQVEVRDEGGGITPEDLEHVFERFYRGIDARQQRFGSGMGLAITSGLLAAEGGRVWAANHSGGGAIFTIAVPAESRTATALDEERL